jgi:uncharacterized protein (TIGR00251 family)
MSGLPYRVAPDGLILHVRLTPKSGRDAIDGVETLSDGKAVLKARVRAVPEDGKANDALIKLIAKTFGVSASHVTLDAGATSRIKTLKIKGEAGALVIVFDCTVKRG